MNSVGLLARRRVAAMGSMAEILVVGGPHGVALTAAVDRLAELERRWSRFIATSEVSVLNRGAGSAVAVSDDTLLLVELACDAWRRTGGRFDPTVLDAMTAIGYTDTLGQARPTSAPTSGGRCSEPSIVTGGCASIVIDREQRTVQLPVGGGFDPGGIGKGLAADLVSHDLRAAGVDSGCVNVGGDLRVWGPGPHGRRWRIGAGGRTMEVTDVGVATSGTERRSWVIDGERVHHLIDPSTSQPATEGPVSVTVVAASAWRAETCATALMLTSPAAIADDATRWDVQALPL